MRENDLIKLIRVTLSDKRYDRYIDVSAYVSVICHLRVQLGSVTPSHSLPTFFIRYINIKMKEWCAYQEISTPVLEITLII